MIKEAIRLRLQHNLSVFPVERHGKRPVFKWERFQRSLANLGEIRSWNPEWNLAMATGLASNIVVVDCESLEDARWFVEHRANTPVRVRTPRGVHLWFRRGAEPVANNQRVRDETGKPRYDIRGDGGYVLLPPSLVMENGADVKQSGGYIFESPLPDLTRLPVFQARWREHADGSGGSSGDRSRKVADGAAYISKIRAVAGQGGHNATFRAVCRLIDAGLSELEALDVLIDWNETNADPPWSRKELMHKVQSTYRSEEKR